MFLGLTSSQMGLTFLYVFTLKDHYNTIYIGHILNNRAYQIPIYSNYQSNCGNLIHPGNYNFPMLYYIECSCIYAILIIVSKILSDQL